MYECEMENDKICNDFTCKEPCEFRMFYGICHNKCTKLRVCACCLHWKDSEKKVVLYGKSKVD